MTARTWLYTKLTTYPGLTALVGDRVFAKKSMTSAIEEHPYIVYQLGNSTDIGLAEDQDINTQFVQIFVHDYSDGEVADYIRVDEVVAQIRLALRLQSSNVHQVFTTQYLETSQDLNDETLNTVFKYLRYQLITRELTHDTSSI